MQALVLVHISSLDTLTWLTNEAQALERAQAMGGAVTAHAGPVIILDQSWPTTGDSAARQWFYTTVENHSSLQWFSHSEEHDGWTEPMARLAALIPEIGATEVRVGGLWATSDGSSGCVHEVCRHLEMNGIPATLEPAWCVFEEEEGWHDAMDAR